MTDENDKVGYSADLGSFKRIGRVVREVETNQKLPPITKRRARFVGRTVEGVMLEDLAGTSDPNEPTKARFQIKTSKHSVDSWADALEPSILTLWNRTPSGAAADAVVFAIELYPDKWFLLPQGGGGGKIGFVPIDVVEGIGSTCDACLCRVVDAECGTGVALDSEVNVWDRSRVYFAVPLELLLLGYGTATLMKVSDAEREALPIDPGPCRYVVDTFYCLEDTLEIP